MRLVAVERISRDKDESTSVDTQDAGITGYAGTYNHKIVATAVDPGVSGGVPIRDRPDVAEVLALVGDAWEGVIMYKLDRGFRDLLDYLKFEREFCRPNGKVIISVMEGIDTSTPAGRQMAQRYVEHAEWELERMRERRSDAAERLIKNGYYNGGTAKHWGYKPERDGNHYRLVPDPAVVPDVQAAAASIISGKSLLQVSAALGIPPTTLTSRLRSAELKGWITWKGEPVRDADGMPVLREQVLDDATWARLQAALSARSAGKGVPKDATSWFGVIWCAACGEKLYMARYRDNGVLRQYYRHRTGSVCTERFNGFRLEERIDPSVRRVFQDVYIPEIRAGAGVDNSEAITRAEESIHDLEDNFIASGGSAEALGRMTSRLESRVARLRDEEKPASTKARLTSELILDRWDSLTSPEERAQFLRSLHVRLFARKDAGGRVWLEVRQGSGRRRHGGPDLAEFAGSDDDWPGLVVDADGRISGGADGAVAS